MWRTAENHARAVRVITLMAAVAAAALMGASLEPAHAQVDAGSAEPHDISHIAYSSHGQYAHAQKAGLEMEFEMSDGEKFAILAGFAAAIIGVFVFLARDIILRRRTHYDSEEYESKRDRTYEKYHSGWTDDYEEIGTRRRSRDFRDVFDDDAGADGQPVDYYGILGVGRDSTSAEIKEAYRNLAKEAHPDRARSGSLDDNHSADEADPDSRMALINRAYEVLSDEDLRRRYDVHTRSTGA